MDERGKEGPHLGLESLLKRRLEAMDPEDELVEGALTPRDYVLG